VDKKRVILKKRGPEALPYHRLIVATGSEPTILPVEGIGKRGVFT
jgi:NAD(P)H-nitrite reductase large subunit